MQRPIEAIGEEVRRVWNALRYVKATIEPLARTLQADDGYQDLVCGVGAVLDQQVDALIDVNDDLDRLKALPEESGGRARSGPGGDHTRPSEREDREPGETPADQRTSDGYILAHLHNLEDTLPHVIGRVTMLSTGLRFFPKRGETYLSAEEMRGISSVLETVAADLRMMLEVVQRERRPRIRPGPAVQ